MTMPDYDKLGATNTVNDELSQTIDDRSLMLISSTDAARVMGTETIDDDKLSNEKDDERIPAISGILFSDKATPSQRTRSRFNTGEMLGSGGSGSVYTLLDNNLKRTVAIKILSPKNSKNEKHVDKFMLEALITSHLEHPNIPPVYNLAMENNKQIYYTMKKINGAPLSTFIIQQQSNPDSNDYASTTRSIDDLISIFIKTAEATAYAHSRGIIHRDIKPDNIMIGDHGEVYLVDWGIAFDKNDSEDHSGHMSGTPLYMSPEQARKESADERSDIYCIGTTFYQVFFKHIPVLAENVDTFWQDKKKGLLTGVKPELLKSMPGPLASICLKCLEAKPANRYADVQELVTDLKTYQNGGMIDAYHYSLAETFQFHLKRSAKHIMWVLALIIFVLGATLFLYQRYQLELSGWGKPIHSESFNIGNDWTKHWVVQDQTHFRTEDQRLVTQNSLGFTWFYNERINGGAAIEFEAENIPGSRPGDLSIVFATDIEDFQNGKKLRKAYYLQHGGLDNTCSMIEDPDGRLDYKILPLQTGVVYKVRGEIDGKQLSLYLDGVLTCSYELSQPLNSGYIGLYAYYENKAFDNIKIYNKELPQITSITATGDLLLENKQYKLAIERYEKIADVHRDTEIGNDSLYKLGLCYFHMGNSVEALSAWGQIKDANYNNHINHFRWNKLNENKQYDTLLKQMGRAIIKTPHPRQVMREWAVHLKTASRSGDAALINKFLDFRQQYFPDDQVFSKPVLEALKITGNASKALVFFPEQDHIVIKALLESGRYNDVITNYPLQQYAVPDALLHMGEYDRVINEHHDLKPLYLRALLYSGKISEAEKAFANNPKIMAHIALNAKGEFRKIIDTYDQTSGHWAHAQLALGNEEVFLAATKESLNARINAATDARTALTLKHYYAGQVDALPKLEALSHNVPGHLLYNYEHSFSIYFLHPLLEHFSGNEDNLQTKIQYIQKNLKSSQGLRLWYCTRLITDEINRHTFMHQPNQLHIEHDFFLFNGIKNDIKGRKGSALKSYRALKDLPQYKKYINATITRFVNHRIDTLTK